jgi:hypothetical protein
MGSGRDAAFSTEPLYRESMPRENVRDVSYAYMLLFATEGA